MDLVHCCNAVTVKHAFRAFIAVIINNILPVFAWDGIITVQVPLEKQAAIFFYDQETK